VSTPGQKKGIFSQRAAQRTKAVIAHGLDPGGLRLQNPFGINVATATRQARRDTTNSIAHGCPAQTA
jgi:hypothetical protein